MSKNVKNIIFRADRKLLLALTRFLFFHPILLVIPFGRIFIIAGTQTKKTASLYFCFIIFIIQKHSGKFQIFLKIFSIKKICIFSFYRTKIQIFTYFKSFRLNCFYTMFDINIQNIPIKELPKHHPKPHTIIMLKYLMTSERRILLCRFIVFILFISFKLIYIINIVNNKLKF